MNKKYINTKALVLDPRAEEFLEISEAEANIIYNKAVSEANDKNYETAVMNIIGYLSKDNFNTVNIDFETFKGNHDQHGRFRALAVNLEAYVVSQDTTYTQRLLFRYAKDSNFIQIDVADGLTDSNSKSFPTDQFQQAAEEFVKGLNYYIQVVSDFRK